MLRATLILAAATAAGAAEVAKVDASTYEAFLAGAQDEWVLLDFYAPWCGHCRRLDPVLTAFAEQHPEVAVGKIDAEKRMNEPLVEAHGADSYPTLRFRRAGSPAFQDYHGPRDAEGFELLAARLSAPPLTTLKTYDDQALEALTAHAPRVAFLLVAPFEEHLAAFEKVANASAHRASFALVEDHRGTGLYPGKIGCVAPNASVHRFPGGATVLQDWVETHNEELVSTLGPHNFRRIGRRRLIVAAVVDPDNERAARGGEALVRAASSGFHPDVRDAFAFGVLDGRRWDEYIETFDLKISDLPRVLVLDRPNERFYDAFRLPEQGDGAVAAAALRNYLRTVARGEAEARFLNWRGFGDRARRFWARRRGWVLGGVFVAVSLFLVISRPGTDHAARAKAD